MEKAEELEQLYEYGCKLFDAVKKEFQKQEELRDRKELTEHLEGKILDLENKLVQAGRKEEELRKMENKLKETKELAKQAENSKTRIVRDIIQILMRENVKVGK